MLSSKQKKAVRLMFRMPDDEVAAQVGVQPRTVGRWRGRPEFQTAVAAEDRAIRNAYSRIAATVALAAARNLFEVLSGAKDAKVALDILKAADAFEQREIAEPEDIEEILRRLEEEEGDD